jgi:hypothetical protein
MRYMYTFYGISHDRVYCLRSVGVTSYYFHGGGWRRKDRCFEAFRE